ncbi:MAG: Hpt domain-containing protein [Phycisphaeraceae bacterium]|nr:Hpt domain-containing protein [Phycisphaeraceae bacterium]
MSIGSHLEALARAAALASPGDLRGLVALRERLRGVTDAAMGPTPSQLGEMALAAADTIERIVLREVEDAEAALEEVRRGIERARRLFSTGENSAMEVASKPGAAAEQPVEFAVDPDLVETIHEFIGEGGEHLAAAEAALLGLGEDPADSGRIDTVFRSFHTIKGVAGFLHLEPIMELAHACECLLDEVRSGRVALDHARLDVVLDACDLMRGLIAVLEGESAPGQRELATMVERIERARGGGPFETPVTRGDGPTRGAPAASGGERGARTIRVDASTLDDHMELVNELIAVHQVVLESEEIRRIGDPRVRRALVRSGALARAIGESARSLRMVTLQRLFERLALVARDAGMRAGREVRLQLEGRQTELDRGVVEAITDPLMHMIRNSCDHGIETPEERIASGKARCGCLTLRAFRSDGGVVIELADDGRGLSRERILKKAAERGMIATSRDPAEFEDREVYNLIMAPGFSTTDRVTDLSGRGVGMDVVKQNIEALGGAVEIDSRPGRGATIRLLLP